MGSFNSRVIPTPKTEDTAIPSRGTGSYALKSKSSEIYPRLPRHWGYIQAGCPLLVWRIMIDWSVSESLVRVVVLRHLFVMLRRWVYGGPPVLRIIYASSVRQPVKLFLTSADIDARTFPYACHGMNDSVSHTSAWALWTGKIQHRG